MPGGQRGADFEHVRPQDFGPRRIEVVRVILHEGSPAREARGHDFHGPPQRGRLPVAFRPKPVARGHQPLHGQARQLLEARQILERVRKGREAAGFEKGPQRQFKAGGVTQRRTSFAARPERADIAY